MYDLDKGEMPAIVRKRLADSRRRLEELDDAEKKGRERPAWLDETTTNRKLAMGCLRLFLGWSDEQITAVALAQFLLQLGHGFKNRAENLARDNDWWELQRAEIRELVEREHAVSRQLWECSKLLKQPREYLEKAYQL